jgi:threonine/homoserine/homoserine lactone efflux protein
MVLEPQTFSLFIAASVALLLVPGPVVLYIVARSLHQGPGAGLVSAVAGATGNAVHALAAALGLSAILASSALAFSVVKYLGAAYLIFIGIRTLLAKDEARLDNPAHQPLHNIYRQGVMVAVFNPKTALFFLAFLPQFVVPSHGAASLQILLLGLTFVLLGLMTDSGYALLAGSVGRSLSSNLSFLRGQRYFAGSVFIALGMGAALTGERK